MKKILPLISISLMILSCKKEGPKSTLDKIVGTYSITRTNIYKNNDSMSSSTGAEEIIQITRAQTGEAFIYGNLSYKISDSKLQGNDLLYGLDIGGPGLPNSAGGAGSMDTMAGIFRNFKFRVDDGKSSDARGFYDDTSHYKITIIEGVKH